jgi:diguanylate cyclase (GGDEF)-like protein
MSALESQLNFAWQLVTSDMETAYSVICAARAMAEAEGDESGVDECVLLEARYDGEMDRYADALEKANRAYARFSERNDAEGRIRACRVFGYLYSRHGQYNSALENLFAALKLIKDSGLHIAEGRYPIEVFLLNNIAFIYAETGRSSDALRFFCQAFDLAKKAGGSMIATILSNIAEMHLNTGDAKLALRYNKMALIEIKRQKLGYHDMHNCYNSFGLIYSKMGEYNRALESFHQSLEVAVKGESKYNQAMSGLALARLHIQTGDAASALECGKMAHKLADEIKANVLLKDICLVLAQASEKNGDMAGALGFYKRHMKLNLEISTREVEQRLSDYTSEFKTEQAQKDAEIYRLKNIELRQKSEELEESNRNITLIGEIGQKITATLDVETLLDVVYESVCGLMEVNLFGVGLYDEQRNAVDFRVIVENGVRLPLFDTIVGESEGYIDACIQRREELVVNDAKADGEGAERMNCIVTNGVMPRSLIYHPLLHAGHVIGVMTVQSYHPNAYTRNNAETIRALGAYVAVALNNSRTSEELRRKAKELEQLSKTDPLTGIYNRRYIIEKMEEERTRFRRYGKKFSLIIVDIDFFKRVNDAWGHDCGDYVLVETANELKLLLREQDCLARWGGEEFLIMLPETDAEGAQRLAERLRQSIEEKVFEYRKKRISVTLTLGICEYGEGISIDDAIRKADNALYEGKNRGRNCVVAG